MNITEIRIRKDGKWYADGNEMFRIPIVNLLARHLERDENGNYFIHFNDEVFPVVVEEVPFTVVNAFMDDGVLILVLHDDQEIRVDQEIPLTLEEGVPYFSFKWQNDTRINRSAFWMISDYLLEKNGRVYLVPPYGSKN